MSFRLSFALTLIATTIVAIVSHSPLITVAAAAIFWGAFNAPKVWNLRYKPGKNHDGRRPPQPAVGSQHR